MEEITRAAGFIGATVGGVHGIIENTAPLPGDPDPAWPRPTAMTTSGRFLDQEWAHDPSVWAWATAAAPGAASLVLADALARREPLLLGPDGLRAGGHTIGVRELSAVGVTTAKGARYFVHAGLPDGSYLCWHEQRARYEIDRLRALLVA
ncbi:hypothetical protein Afil01_13180 [Actinorhabdospora filicis]|uniref:Uncharacterized protein n=1 Tax=Actinorhabdospora filicis TaxID=1785913 RepID=A0A9W6SKY8_9ACTN|nr:hypothetical protein [Actinorhabdospora filicis]GLZ76511.1 hypothetical protein Afil01_13180 [Actinorhabdospora filicis]